MVSEPQIPEKPQQQRPLLRIDHVTIAGRQLQPLRQAFTAAGLEPEYGGPHSNRITHMALVGFDDGSYLELISTLQPGQASPWWDRHIAQDGGLCGWAVQVSDIRQEAKNAFAQGIPVAGPASHQRLKPDGTQIEWDLVFLGSSDPGSTLPFLIADRTPRRLRVRPSPSVADSELVGVQTVVLGVNSLVAGVEQFKRLFGWSALQVAEDSVFGAYLARFPGQPFVLAEPMQKGSWLSDRLQELGESPCACLLASTRLDVSRRRLHLQKERPWFGEPVAWFDPATLRGLRLGVVEV